MSGQVLLSEPVKLPVFLRRCRTGLAAGGMKTQGRSMTASEIEIMAVGAGPCGLMLANELGRRGIRVLVADQDEGVATAPQANATQARTMEHYRRLGFSEEIRKLGMPPDYPTDVAYFTTYSGWELGRHEMPPSGEAGRVIRELEHVWNGAELPHRIPQSHAEQVMYRHARELPGVEIMFNWSATGFEESEGGIVTHLKHTKTGEERSVRSQYMFAADGGSSIIRKQLGIRYGGEEAQRDFMGGHMLSVYIDAPEFYNVVKAPKAWMYWTFNRRRRALLASIDGHGKFVMQTQLREGESMDGMDKAYLSKLFVQAMGCDLPHTITGFESWLAGRALVAEKFGAGRVLLGGDAVHLFTPTGGMGYNTAVGDAVNIGWKLAEVVRGRASPALLDSYEMERKPIAHRNTRFAAGFADSVGLYVPSPAIEDEGRAGEAARKRAGAYLARHGREEFTIPGFTFGYRYDSSPAICHDNAPKPNDIPGVYVPTGKPGGRAPHVWREDGSSLFDLFGFNWTLLAFADEASTVKAFEQEAQRRGIDIKVVDLRDEPVAADLYDAPFALIRPDQIVGWRGASVDSAAAKQVFDRLLGYAAP
jgi:2-polyprenyl-6-methoxyphenol hydroxylase-like FAD-dependent oxidoreductase